MGGGRVLIRFRTWRGRRAAIRYLDALALAVKVRGYRCVKLYAREFPRPLLWVYVNGLAEDVGVVVGARMYSGSVWVTTMFGVGWPVISARVGM